MLGLIACSVLNSGHSNAAGNDLKQKVQSYSVGLGGTRLIYPENSGGVFMQVNNPNEYPMLVQSLVLEENKSTPASFIVTPPVFRLDGKQQSRVRVIMSGSSEQNDRESLKWLCVTGIPPELGDEWIDDAEKKAVKEAELQIKVRVSRCIKLLVRPGDLQQKPAFVKESIAWARHGDKIQASNKTPFFMSFGTLKAGKNEIANPDYIPPFGTKDFTIPAGSSGELSWTLITDEGSSSGPFSVMLP
ncbi:fimbria/pilus periplasmic chaperone [Lelliottia sp. SL45]|uniref:fimbria/pilus periplasmic chaperone n=1 Tax=Lelliottia sp. SL45 TaxID=2994665 RepID=UPI0022754AA7|nr:fimbria/pilus periplasmic chaperone [Lelliottia sp. SL45]MCY1700983.1 fimbria/pilus periplasmic chaperone [Lelliottia sp. SL45]